MGYGTHSYHKRARHPNVEGVVLKDGRVLTVYYAVGSDRLLMVATDRVSAFDVVLPQPIPRKGEVLTLISAWWFARTRDIVTGHFADGLDGVDNDGELAGHPVQLLGAHVDVGEPGKVRDVLTGDLGHVSPGS